MPTQAVEPDRHILADSFESAIRHMLSAPEEKRDRSAEPDGSVRLRQG
jgi:hypothetical protein